MTAHYSLFRNPKRENEEGESTLHARLVDQHTIRMEDLNEEISDACSFNSADVKGILDALRSRIIMHLKRGEILELEGIGTFSISLKSRHGRTKRRLSRNMSSSTRSFSVARKSCGGNCP